MGEILFSGQLTQDELTFAYRMATRLKKWYFIAYWIALAGVGAFFLYMFFTFHYLGCLPYPLIFLLFIGMSYYFTPALMAKRLFGQDSDFNYPLSGVISEDGLSIQSSRTQTQIQWGLIKLARLSPGNVILNLANNAFYTFPRKFFANEVDWKDFRSLVEQKVGTKENFVKDPGSPRYGRYAGRFIYGGLGLSVILMVIYLFLFASNP